MIRFKFKLNNEKYEALIPENWQEVKVKHYRKLEQQSPKFNFEVLACFTDIDFKAFANSESKQDIEAITSVMSFLNDDTILKSLKRKEQLQIGNKVIKPPKNVLIKAIGQKEMAMQVISKYSEENNNIDIDDIIHLCAIYFQREYNGTFDPDKVEYIKHYIMEMPIVEVIPWFRFFFRKLSRRRIFGIIDFNLSLKTLKNLPSMLKQARKDLHNSQALSELTT